MLSRIMLVIGWSLLIPAVASAKYARPDLEKVPVARVVENLKKLVQAEPKKVEPLLNLARAHAMAYALKAGELEINRRTPDDVWYGYEPAFVPFAGVKETDNKEQAQAAAEHLEKAIKAYQQALKLDPDHLTVRIGHAWITAEAGQKDEAVKLYRKLIHDAWTKREKNLESLGLGGHTITAEAGGYLIALLDEEQDKAEIADLQTKIAKLQKLPRPVTPIAVPLRDKLTAADIEDRQSRVAFDADGSGLSKTWSWITADAAWLVYDPQGTGEIKSALQMFGSVTFWMFWSNGYEALASLDDDRDGKLSGNELRGLALWHDKNGDGVSDPGEVQPLAEHGIVALSCRWEVLTDHPDSIAHSPRGVTYRDGKTRPTYDVILHAE